MNKLKEEHQWRKLDNSAKIFPISAGKKYSTVFRYSIVMKEEINTEILGKAVKSAINKFKYFRVKLQRGMFWHYLDYNNKFPVIEEESEYPCVYVNPKDSNDYLFRISYFKNKISIDYFHALCDGNSALEFLKEIVYRYIEISNPNVFESKELRDRKFLKYDIDANDDYIKNYDKRIKNKKEKNKLAYILKGDRIPIDQIATIHEYVKFTELKEVAKKYDATVTEYLASVLIYAIYSKNMDKTRKEEKPLKVCIPVNLRRFFKSKTVSNFFSFFVIDADIKNKELTDFEKTVTFVKKEFSDKLTLEAISNNMSKFVKIAKNPMIKYIPLPIKLLIVRIAYKMIRKYTSITYSNIGRFGVIKEYQEYIDHVLFMIAPEPVEKIKVSSISYGNYLSISFTTNMIDTEIEEEFMKILENHGIEVAVESNNVIPVCFEKTNKKIPILKTEYPDKPNKIRKIILQIHNYKKVRNNYNLWEIIKKRVGS